MSSSSEPPAECPHHRGTGIVEDAKATSPGLLALAQTSAAATPVNHQQPTSTATEIATSECPVGRGATAPAGKLPNVMPPVSQQPAPGQTMPLSTERVKSSIPLGGTKAAVEGKDDEGVWVYPSEQMFYNALKRKNYNASEQDMERVVQIHNAVNERSWHEIMKWERAFHSDCPNPKLLRFEGLPGTPSPRARLLTFFGYVASFDRHDWVVDRCGTQVRYIIDFYHGRSSDPSKPASFYLDVRPAITAMGLIDRFRMAVASYYPAAKKAER